MKESHHLGDFMQEDVRWKQRMNSFRKAFRQLQAGVAITHERKLSDLERQGLIQAFEFTHELAWNVMKDFLSARGATQPMYGSRDATREAFAAGLLDEADVWMEMIGDRNRTSHTYNEETADRIIRHVVDSYVHCMEQFERTMTEKEAQE